MRLKPNHLAGRNLESINSKNIAHISIIFSKGRMSGVVRKLTEMAEAANSAGLSIDFYLLNREKSGREGNLIFVKIDTSIGRFAGLKIRGLKYRYISCLVPTNEYYALVLRYSFADPSMLSFMRKHQGKVFFEHHTKELQEVWRSGMPSLVKLITYLFEIFLAPRGLRNASGIVAVTNEFLEHQQKRARLPLNMPLLVLPNGAKFSSRPIKLNSIESVFRFVFVADRFRPWHGLPRLLASLLNYDGESNIEVFLVGHLNSTQVEDVRIATDSCSKVQIIRVGELEQAELLQLLSRCHLAIDSLSTYKLAMSESSTLKVRLYLEAGIPWISAAPDVDVGGDSRLCYLVPNTCEVFALEPLLSWRKHLDADHFATVVEQLRQKMDWKVKLKTLSSWIFEELDK